MESTSTTAVSILCEEYAREMREELRATRECLEQVPTDKFDWKPHAKSMELGYLAQLVADIPRWLQIAIEDGVVDFETYPQFKGKTNAELVAHLEQSVDAAVNALSSIADADLDASFVLRRGDTVLMKSSKRETISSSINHMVHHRGQLSVYLRLLDEKVPSLYGPSADTPGF